MFPKGDGGETMRATMRGACFRGACVLLAAGWLAACGSGGGGGGTPGTAAAAAAPAAAATSERRAAPGNGGNAGSPGAAGDRWRRHTGSAGATGAAGARAAAAAPERPAAAGATGGSAVGAGGAGGAAARTRRGRRGGQHRRQRGGGTRRDGRRRGARRQRRNAAGAAGRGGRAARRRGGQRRHAASNSLAVRFANAVMSRWPDPNNIAGQLPRLGVQPRHRPARHRAGLAPHRRRALPARTSSATPTSSSARTAARHHHRSGEPQLRQHAAVDLLAVALSADRDGEVQDRRRFDPRALRHDPEATPTAASGTSRPTPTRCGSTASTWASRSWCATRPRSGRCGTFCSDTVFKQMLLLAQHVRDTSDGPALSRVGRQPGGHEGGLGQRDDGALAVGVGARARLVRDGAGRSAPRSARRGRSTISCWRSCRAWRWA